MPGESALCLLVLCPPPPAPPCFNLLFPFGISQMRADRLRGDEHIMQTYEEKCAEFDKCQLDWKAADAKLAAVMKRMDEMKVSIYPDCIVCD